MLYTKPISEISYEEVVQFCELEKEESFVLDYKREIDRSLIKTVASMANTYGGIVIIGVEDNDGKPTLPAVGFDYTEGISERLTGLIIDNVYPPFFPEVQVCEPKGSKTFAVVRVSQSNLGPHAINSNRRVYIRTGNQSRPEDFESIDKILWLSDKRERFTLFKGELVNDAYNRYKNLCSLEGVSVDFGELTISCSPLYPEKSFITPLEVKNDLVSRKFSVNYESSTFPYLARTTVTPTPNGIYLFSGGNVTFYTYINQFGLIYHTEDIGLLREEMLEGGKTHYHREIHLSTALLRALLTIEFSHRYQRWIGNWGALSFNFRLNKIIKIPVYPAQSGSFQLDSAISIEKRYMWKKIITVSELEKDEVRKGMLKELFVDLHWSFSHEVRDEIAMKWIETKYKQVSPLKTE